MSAVRQIDREEWIRSPLDVDLARKAVSAARRALLSHDREASPREIILALIAEAADTERAIKRPGPRGHVSCMPEVYHTASEIFATEVEMIADKISYAPKIKPSVSADAASRYIEVTKWLRYAQGKDRKQSKELIWLAAQGFSTRSLAKRYGFPNPDAAGAALRRRLNEIVNRLNKDKIFD